MSLGAVVLRSRVVHAVLAWSRGLGASLVWVLWGIAVLFVVGGACVVG